MSDSTHVQSAERGQVATHLRCATHDAVFPSAQYYQHCQEHHAGQLITITPVWQDA